MTEHNFLYLLSEDDNDDVFYKACLEKIHNCEYEIIPTRIRKGGGISAVRQALTPFLSAIKNTGPVPGLFHSKNGLEGIQAKFAETFSLSHIGKRIGAVKINR